MLETGFEHGRAVGQGGVNGWAFIREAKGSDEGFLDGSDAEFEFVHDGSIHERTEIGADGNSRALGRVGAAQKLAAWINTR